MASKRITPTQALILRNLRDDGQPFHGRHGGPRGLAQHGGWNRSLYALFDKGLVDLMTCDLTEAGRKWAAEDGDHGQ